MEIRMSGRLRSGLRIAAGAAAASLVAVAFTLTAPQPSSAQRPGQPSRQVHPGADAAARQAAETMLEVPVSKLAPGGVSVRPQITSPAIEDLASAAERGMRYFNNLNCVGCHAANGAGGMGPSLSNRTFIYGAEPENIYLSIVQGRPNGMPAWGSLLPQSMVWDLVAYVGSISNAPSTQWGTTVSRTSPSIEQVPAEFKQTPTPWQYTQSFSNGQKP